jgi:acyl dehydratase
MQAAARAAGLPGCVTPGLLTAALFPALIGSQLVQHCRAAPTVLVLTRSAQPGTLYLRQEVRFRAVAPVGAVLHASVTATRRSGRTVVFDTRCVLDATGELLIDGTALALLPLRTP